MRVSRAAPCVLPRAGVLRRHSDREEQRNHHRHSRFDSDPLSPLRAASLRVSPTRRTCVPWWRCPPLLFSHSLSLSLTRHPLPSPLSPATPHATQHKPHQRRETRHMSGTTFEAANPDSRRKPPCATCRPSRSTFDEARHTSERSNMAATYRSVANH